MKAIVQNAYGSPGLLELREVAEPEVASDELLLRVRATSVNRADWYMMVGKPFPARLSAGLLGPGTRIPGLVLAGTVERRGEAITKFEVGDEVFGYAQGCYAERTTAREDQLELKPSNATFEQAATLPLAGATALQGLQDHGEMTAGDRVLINGASGGVGTFAIQIAKALGGEVTGVCSAGNLEQARSLGADHVIDYAREDFTDTKQRYDLVLDLAGSRPLSAVRRILSAKGRHICIGGPMRHLFTAALASVFQRHIKVFDHRPSAPALAVLKDLVEAGKLQPVIERTYTLSEIPEALRHHGEGHSRGKVAITVP